MASPDHHDHSHDHDPAPRRAMSFAEGWLGPWPHTHFSRRGTPLVHVFNLEPAFLGRELFVDYRVARGDGEDEYELEAELEWALTRRVGLLVEAPLVQINPEEGDTETGVGDVAVAGRLLLVDGERFLLSGNLEVSFPTGDEDRGLGAGEFGLAPSLSAWLDVGNWVAAHAQVGTEHGLEGGDSELFYGAALTYSFRGPRLLPGGGGGRRHADHEHGHAGGTHARNPHFPPGLTSLIAEYAGRTALSGDDDGVATGEATFGVSHNLTESLEIRGGYQIPVGRPQEIDEGFVFGLIYHF